MLLEAELRPAAPHRLAELEGIGLCGEAIGAHLALDREVPGPRFAPGGFQGVEDKEATILVQDHRRQLREHLVLVVGLHCVVAEALVHNLAKLVHGALHLLLENAGALRKGPAPADITASFETSSLRNAPATSPAAGRSPTIVRKFRRSSRPRSAPSSSMDARTSSGMMRP